MKARILALALIVFIAPVYAEPLPQLPPGPLLLTSATPDMLHPEYWISRLPEPDKILKTPEEMKVFNQDIYSMVRDTMDVFKFSDTRSGKPVRDQIKLEYNAVKGRGLLDVSNNKVPLSVFENEIKPVASYDQVPDKIKIKWGAAIRATSVRALPTDIKMLEKPDDIEFDMLQFTLIKLWTPVTVLHQSPKGDWYYVQAPYTRGWVKAKDIALFPSKLELKKDVKSSSFLVVLGESISVFQKPSFDSVLQRPSMGTILPLVSKSAGAYVVKLPRRGKGGKVFFEKGYISRKADAATRFPAYTQANIIRQAFKLLGARYGWGGMYNGRDCSGFTHDVFLSLGLAMPRSSMGQAYVGTQLGHFEYKNHAAEKAAVLDQAVPGITLLRMPHHQMLYLGKVNGQYFVIHCTWAERISMTSDEKNRINQVVVSDLNLNGKSHLGSLFDRIIAMSEIN